MKRFFAFLCCFLLAGSLVAPPAEAAAAGVRLKLSFGWCESACEIRIRITNKSRYDIAWVGGTCRLTVNGRYVGKGTVYLGPIKRGHSRSSTCNVVDDRLEDAWWEHQDGASFVTYATVKAIPHYRYRR
ncbi:hypothetical protein ACFXJ8_16245 [Nonomuraea sp. NPDC059194]|uniref:hypothetical protein n=1 Tax=Nonomuraea sp. NPDC059194 TaxID=3346764 RepID=UPI0036CB04F7